MQCVNKTIIDRTSQAKSSYSRPEKEKHKLQTPSKKLGKINTLNTVFKSVNKTKINVIRCEHYQLHSINQSIKK